METPSTPSEDTVPPARLVAPKAKLAPTDAGARRGSLWCSQQLATAAPIDEDAPLLSPGVRLGLSLAQLAGMMCEPSAAQPEALLAAADGAGAKLEGGLSPSSVLEADGTPPWGDAAGGEEGDAGPDVAASLLQRLCEAAEAEAAEAAAAAQAAAWAVEAPGVGAEDVEMADADGSAGAPGTTVADAAAAAAADALFFEALARLIDAHAALCVPPPPHPAA